MKLRENFWRGKRNLNVYQIDKLADNDLESTFVLHLLFLVKMFVEIFFSPSFRIVEKETMTDIIDFIIENDLSSDGESEMKKKDDYDW